MAEGSSLVLSMAEVFVRRWWKIVLSVAANAPGNVTRNVLDRELPTACFYLWSDRSVRLVPFAS